MNRRFNWIFFDLDGILADSIPALYEVYIHFLEKFEIKGTKEEFEELNGPSLPEIITTLKTKHRLAADKDYLMSLYKSEILDAYKNHIKLFDGLSDILKEIKNKEYSLLLVTSAIQEIAIEFIKKKKLDVYFKNYVFGNEVNRSKPDSEIYNLALKKANVSSDLVLIIEDSCNGIKSAKATGAFVIGLANNQTKEDLLKAGANRIILKLKDILPIL